MDHLVDHRYVPVAGGHQVAVLYQRSVRLVVFDAGVELLADNEQTSPDPQDLDGRAIQCGQARRCQHLVRRPERPTAIDHEDDAVDDVKDRVHVMGDEHHGSTA